MLETTTFFKNFGPKMSMSRPFYFGILIAPLTGGHRVFYCLNDNAKLRLIIAATLLLQLYYYIRLWTKRLSINSHSILVFMRSSS